MAIPKMLSGYTTASWSTFSLKNIKARNFCGIDQLKSRMNSCALAPRGERGVTEAPMPLLIKK